MANTRAASGSGFFSKLIVLLLFALAIGLYLRIVMVDGKPANYAPLQQVSVPVIEGDAPAPDRNTTALRELPADQMAIIMQVFAPRSP
jgi:hypothetical protein